jgi:hypothetical protein
MKKMKNENNLPESASRNLFSRGYGKAKQGIVNALERRAERHAENDVVFTEPLTPAPAEAPKPLTRGGVDMWFLFISMVLICFGAIMSYSAGAVFAEQRYDDPTYFFVRYVIFAAFACFVSTLFVIFARPWFWRMFGAAAYLGAIFLLLLVMVIGDEGGGAQRWIAIGPITIQPSEVAKTAIVMVLALYMAKYEKEISSTHFFGGSFKHGVFMPAISVNVKIEAMRRDIVCISYECGTAASLMIAGIVAYLEETIPSGIEVSTTDKRVNIYPQRFKQAEKVLEYFALSNLTFEDNAINIGFSMV